MNRMIRLMSGVLVVAAVAACNNDPSLDLSGDSGDPTRVQATPQVMFINQGATKTLLLRLTDDANFATPVGAYTISDLGPGLTVTWDSTYRPNYIPGTLTPDPIQTQHRYTVRATQAVGTSFKVTNQGITQEIQVKVIPTSLPVTYSAVTGGLVDVSSENFVFTPTTLFDFGGAVQQPLSVSADGHTATIVASSGTPTISGARASYIPTVGLPAIPATTALVGPATPYGGTTQANAPTIALPAASFTFSDAGTPAGPDAIGGGGPNVWYKFTVDSDRHIDITLSWSTTPGSDFDWELVDAGLNHIAGAAAGGAGPEHASADITAGTYYFVIIDWNQGSTTPLPWWKMVITP